VPFTVKDNLSAAGTPMAIGARERAAIVPAVAPYTQGGLELPGLALIAAARRD
jgi:hypothetical protein